MFWKGEIAVGRLAAHHKASQEAPPCGEVGKGSENVSGMQRQDQMARHTGFEALVRSNQDRILRYCAQRLGQARAEEIAQDIFLAAWQGLHTFRHEAAIDTWLFAIARRKCAQALRNGRRRAEIFQEVTRNLRIDTRQTAHDPYGEAMIVQQQWSCLAQRLHALRDEERLLLNLRYTKGMAIREISELLGKSGGAVRKRIGRLLHQLREEMQHHPSLDH